MELVCEMKTVVTDFAAVQVQAEEVIGSEAASEVNSALASDIQESLAGVVSLQSALETAASSLEGRIEMEEVKWRGVAGSPLR